MRRRIILLVIFVLLFTSVCSARTLTTTYTIDEYGLSISFPAEMDVFTRDTPADSSLLALYGWDKEELDAEMEEYNDYIYAFTPAYPDSFSLSAEEYVYYDYRSLSDSELNEMAKNFADSSREEFPPIDYGIYRSKENVFIYCTYMSAADSSVWMYYETLVDNLLVRCYYGDTGTTFTPEQEDMVLNIIDSISFASDSSIPTTEANRSEEIGTTQSKSTVIPPDDNYEEDWAESPSFDNEKQEELMRSTLTTALVVIIVLACGGILTIILLLIRAKKINTSVQSPHPVKTEISVSTPETLAETAWNEPESVKETPAEEPAEEISHQEPAEETSAAKVQFCRHCGFRLPANGFFCPKCGTKVLQDAESG